MKGKLQKLIKNQKGMTLVELLAVIVILAIVTAIAVPSIGNIIKDSKKSAHNSNALMIINATKIGIANQDATIIPTDTAQSKVVSLDDLVTAGYLDVVPQDPSVKGKTYDSEKSKVTIKKASSGAYSYSIVLFPSGTGKYYVNATEKELNGGSNN